MTCLTYAPAAHLGINRLRNSPATTLSQVRFTGVSDDCETILHSTANAVNSYLLLLSFPLPLELEFKELVGEWKEDTRFLSSPEAMSAHSAYKRIIGMGDQAVPLILREMRREPGFWFEALTAITGAQPVSEDHAGDLEAMCADWLAWGRRNGFR